MVVKKQQAVVPNRGSVAQPKYDDGDMTPAVDVAFRMDCSVSSSEGENNSSSSSTSKPSPEALSKRQNPDHSLRYFMLTILCIVTFFGSFGMWAFGRSIEKNEFRSGFEALASKLASHVDDFYADNIVALRSAAGRFTAIGEESTPSWPFVDSPRFDDLFVPYLQLTKSTAIFMAPVVYDRDRLTWETIQHAADSNDYLRYIHDDRGRSPEANAYAPIRQYYPNEGSNRLVNYNLLSRDAFAGELQPVLNGFPVVSKTFISDSDKDTTSLNDEVNNIQGTLGPLVYLSTPM
jgi:hypothetical protein